MEFLHWDLKSVGLYWILLILCLKEDIMVLNVCVKFEVHWNYASRVTGPNIIYTILHFSGAYASKNSWLVGPSVTFQFERLVHWIFLIFCMVLGFDKVNKVTKPDF